MTKSSSNISEKFLNNFPEIFNSPQKVNSYLIDHSQNVEKIIITNLNKLLSDIFISSSN